MSSRLLALPAELRNNIYEYALSDLHQAPRTPYMICKTDFSTYTSLQLVNRQIAHESKYILSQYAQDLTICVNDIPQLYDILAASQSTTPSLSTARFRVSISMIPRLPPKPHEGVVVGAFIAFQHAWSRRHIEPFQSYDKANPRDSPAYRLWEAPRAGPQVVTEPLVDGRMKVVEPEFGNGLRYTHYTRIVRLNEGDGAVDVAIIEGRVRDLAMDDEGNVAWMRGN